VRWRTLRRGGLAEQKREPGRGDAAARRSNFRAVSPGHSNSTKSMSDVRS
jgi:hypothetical protein